MAPLTSAKTAGGNEIKNSKEITNNPDVFFEYLFHCEEQERRGTPIQLPPDPKRAHAHANWYCSELAFLLNASAIMTYVTQVKPAPHPIRKPEQYVRRRWIRHPRYSAPKFLTLGECARWLTAHTKARPSR